MYKWDKCDSLAIQRRMDVLKALERINDKLFSAIITRKGFIYKREEWLNLLEFGDPNGKSGA